MLRTVAEAGDDAAEHKTAAVTIIASLLLLLVVVPEYAAPTAARSALGVSIAGPRCESAARPGTVAVLVVGDWWGESRRLLAWLRDRFMNAGRTAVRRCRAAFGGNNNSGCPRAIYPQAVPTQRHP